MFDLFRGGEFNFHGGTPVLPILKIIPRMINSKGVQLEVRQKEYNM